MGVGSPEDLVECVSRGIDCFDSVYPTKNGRHGTIFTSKGNLDITKTKYSTDFKPLDENCDVMKQLEESIAGWAKTQPNLRAILVVGSKARNDHPGDQWSDLDLQVFATDFQEYLSGTDWLGYFGAVWMCLPFHPAGSEPQRLAIFAGGHKVDFHFFPLSELLRMVQMQTLDDVYLRGYYALLDKDGLAAKLPPAPGKPFPGDMPSVDSFMLCVSMFWFGALACAKMIWRGDLWSVKTGDSRLKSHLLSMLEWHARAVHGWEYDTWHSGKFLFEWTDPLSRQTLYEIFAHFDRQDSKRALFATMDLFRRLARETADRLGYTYPSSLDEQISHAIAAISSSDPVW